MSDHVIRNPDHLDGSRRLRDLLRQGMPNGSAGFVAEDLDVVLRWYGRRFDQDQDGAFALIEVKHGSADLPFAQRMTFGVLDRALRAGPDADRYLGLWVLNDYGDRWTLRVELDDAGLLRWLGWCAK